VAVSGAFFRTEGKAGTGGQPASQKGPRWSTASLVRIAARAAFRERGKQIVPIPIGAFALTFVGDVVHAVTKDPFWYRFAFICLGVGIVSALIAAVFGLIDYFGVKMSEKGRQIATIHMVCNLVAVVFYIVNFVLRRDNGALNTSRWPFVMGFEVTTFLALGVSGWLGGKLAFEHKVGVAEHIDPEATKIGMTEPG